MDVVETVSGVNLSKNTIGDLCVYTEKEKHSSKKSVQRNATGAHTSTMTPKHDVIKKAMDDSFLYFPVSPTSSQEQVTTSDRTYSEVAQKKHEITLRLHLFSHPA